jgi:hypothetical protein
VALLGTAPAVMTGPIGFLLAAPTLLALLGGALEIRGLQKTGLVLMVLLSLGLIVIGGWLIQEDARSSSDNFDGLGTALGLVAIAPACLLGLGAFLMRHPAWRTEDEEDETA